MLLLHSQPNTALYNVNIEIKHIQLKNYEATKCYQIMRRGSNRNTVGFGETEIYGFKTFRIQLNKWHGSCVLIDPNLGANDQKCPEVLYHTKKTLKSQVFWVDLYQKGKHVAVLASSPLLCTSKMASLKLQYAYLLLFQVSMLRFETLHLAEW